MDDSQRESDEELDAMEMVKKYDVDEVEAEEGFPGWISIAPSATQISYL